MTEALQTFNFGNSVIRVFGTPFEPLFVAADICKALNIQNTTQALEALEPFEKTTVEIEQPNPSPTDPMLNIGSIVKAVNAVTESGLYTLILRCRDAVKEGTPAYRFRLKVTSEILPSIRLTGRYKAKETAPKSVEENKIDAYFAIARHMVSLARVDEKRASAYALAAIQETTGLPTEGFRQALPSVKPKDQAVLNATAVGKEIGLRPAEVNKKLEALGLIEKDPSGKGWVLTEAGTQYGEARPYVNHGHSGFDIKWRRSVFELLKGEPN